MTRPLGASRAVPRQVLDATQRGLQVDLRLLRRRLLDAEAAVAKDEEKAVALEEQKDQVPLESSLALG